MMANLELSERNAYNPVDFCYAFKQFDANPVDIKIQADTQEFLNLVFEKLEKSLDKTIWKGIVSGVFGGT